MTSQCYFLILEISLQPRLRHINKTRFFGNSANFATFEMNFR